MSELEKIVKEIKKMIPKSLKIEKNRNKYNRLNGRYDYFKAKQRDEI